MFVSEIESNQVMSNTCIFRNDIFPWVLILYIEIIVEITYFNFEVIPTWSPFLCHLYESRNFYVVIQTL